ncbi:LemA family protein [Virgibacillus ndiopensis]|uniref:LemA family protein n=1 Tax=Virgibacillus ndiopensis TaxID=2004408 RepID=UPI000C06F0A9|nr:LemA family protein [Virgibacillus ndiopensis]
MDIEPWMIWTTVIILAVIVIILLYNRFIFLKNKVAETFNAIDIFLAQRFDALTNIAESVAAYTDHEKEVFMEVTKLRQRYDTESNNEKIKTVNEASRLISGLQIQVENYPELKASENYLHLQKTIYDLEEKISASRRTYNARVNQYNNWTQSFPMKIMASMMNLEKKELLQIEEAKKQDVNIRSILRG